jgi:hypothetical protein
VKRFLLFVSGIAGQQRLLAAVRGPDAAGGGVWKRYMDASHRIVERWGSRRMKVVLLGHYVGVWLMAALFVLMSIAAGALVLRSFFGAQALRREVVRQLEDSRPAREVKEVIERDLQTVLGGADGHR